jgi:hypothetical protein
MNPYQVRFSQDSIKYQFADGTTIDDLAAQLKSGNVQAHDIPALRLVEKEGLLYTLDNRRLEAFRRAGSNISWRMASSREIAEEAWKFTTTNGGITVRVRGE